jgi:hypothetical protein
LTAITQRVPLDQIGERAAAASPGRAALTVIVMVLFGAGWLAARILGAAWAGLAWSAAAAAEGWAAGRTGAWAAHVEARRAASAGRPG